MVTGPIEYGQLDEREISFHVTRNRSQTEFSLNGDCGAERSPRPTVLVILARFAV